MASGYITGVVSLIFFVPTIIGSQEDNFLMPVGMLSLLVLSVAVMAYLFFYHPVVMLLDGKREEAMRQFLTTLGTFAAVTVIIFIISLLLSR